MTRSGHERSPAPLRLRAVAALLGIPALALSGCAVGTAPAAPAAPAAFDAATRDDAAFDAVLTHEFADVAGYLRPPAGAHRRVELYRTLDEDERANTAAAPVAVPTLLMTAEGGLAVTAPTLAPRLRNVTRQVEVRGSGHWLPEQAPDVVTAHLLDFFASTRAQDRVPRAR